MAYDFPASPSVGTLFAPAGGPTWQWNGTAWLAVSPAGLVQEAPVDGQNYVRRNGVWVLAPGTAEAKNRIVNGAMQVSQENGAVGGTVAGYYPADQWLISTTGLAAGACSCAQDVVTDISGLPYIVSIPGAALASIPAAAHWMLTSNVEGNRINDFSWGTAVGKQAVLRFFVMGNVPGTYGVSVRNTPGSLNQFVGTFDITAADAANYATATWAEKTIVIPPPPVGSVWGTGTAIGLQIFFALALASDKTGAAGWSTTSRFGTSAQVNFLTATANRLRIRGVGLYLDPQNTGIAPPWQMPDEAEELRTCMRYWQKNASTNTTTRFSGNVTSGQNYYTTVYLPVVMRTVASVSVVNVDAANFPATAGAVGPDSQGFYEGRTASATATGRFASNFVANARM